MLEKTRCSGRTPVRRRRLLPAALLSLLLGSPFEGIRAQSVVRPKEYEKREGTFRIPKIIELKVTAEAADKLRLLADSLEGTDISLRVSTFKKTGRVEVVQAGDFDYPSVRIEVPPRPEGYRLEVTPGGFLLMARDPGGLQWGLKRLVDALDFKTGTIPCFKVRDWPDTAWRGVHILMPTEKDLPLFRRFVDEILVPYHFNTVVLEIDYKFAYESHREVSEPGARSPGFCKQVAELLRNRGLRVIPEFNCLGHQSWKEKKGPLLKAYPEFDETPNLPSDDKGLYCRSWCPRHPALRPLLFDIWQELLSAFDCRYFHIGMDEVFLIAERECPRCGVSTPWEVFLGAASEYNAYFRGAECEVLMWGDRLIKREGTSYSKFEASDTDTWKAAAYLPRDIIICDWHYGVLDEYPSLKSFQDQGFRVLACPWSDVKNVESLWKYAQKVRTNRFLGFLATTWVPFSDLAGALFEGKGSGKAKGAAACLKRVGTLCWEGKKR